MLPTRDRRRLLERALASVLAQREAPPFEVVVVDDGSGDETADWLGEVDDPRLTVVRRDVPGGASAARNAGVRAARGPTIVFLDDDDELDPEFLARMDRHLAAAPEVGFAWCGVRRWDDRTGRPLGERLPTDPLSVGTGFGLCVRRSWLEDVGGFDESLDAGVDFDLLIRLSQRCQHLAVREVLVTVHLHEGPQLTDLGRGKAESFERILAKHRETFDAQPALAVSFSRKAATLWYRLGEARRGRRLLLGALRRQPAQWATWRTLLAFESRPLRRSLRKLDD